MRAQHRGADRGPTVTIEELILKIEAQGGDKLVATMNQAANSADKVEAAGKRATTATSALGKEMADTAADAVKLDRSLSGVGSSFDEIGKHSGDVERQLAGVMGVQGKLATSSKLASHEMINLGRQFADVGVSLASGQKPWMVAIQQGAQIGDVFSTARARGVGFGAALGQVAAAAAPLVAILAPAAAAAAAVGSAFAISAHELNEEHKNLIGTLGLTSDQLKKVGDQSITTMDVMKGTFNATSKALTDAFKPEIAAVESAFDHTMHGIAGAAVNAVKINVGAFTGGFEAIKATWNLLPDAIGDAAMSAANLAVSAIEGLVNKSIDALNQFRPTINAMLMATGAPIRLPELDHVSLARLNNEFAGAMGNLAKVGREAFNAGFVSGTSAVDAGLAAIERETLKAYEARVRGLAGEAKATKDKTDATKKATGATLEAVTAGKAFDANYVSTIDLIKKHNEQLKLTPAALDDAVRGMEEFRRSVQRAADDALQGFDALFQGIRNKDWGSALGGLSSALASITGSVGGLVGAIGNAGKGAFLAQGLHLGTGNGAADIGLSIGGSIAGSMLASSTIGTSIAAGIANGVVGLGGSAALAGTMGTILSSAAFLGPVAAIVALGLGSLLAGKPTNAGAGFDLVSGQLSGNKRTSETESAAKAAGSAILSGEDMLRALKIGLPEIITGVVIGTRDPSQIYTSGGRTITSAVGDNAAAAEAALKAVLETATFQSEAQEKVAKSALAAGKSFDQVLEVLSKYESAQGLSQSITDAIQGFLDPQGAAVTQLTRAQEARAAEIKAATDAGYLTTEQFDELTGKLATLNGLELADTLKKFASSVTDATDKLKDMVLSALNDNLSTARDDLRDAYQRDATAIQGVIDKNRALANSLDDYLRSLNVGPVAMLSPEEAYRQAKAAFEATPVGSEGLQGVSETFLEASKAYNSSSEGYFKDLAAVKRAVGDSAAYEKSQVSTGERELALLKDQVAPYLNDIKKNTLDTVSAILGVQAAIGLLASVQRANDNTPYDASGNINYNGGVAPTANYGDQGLLQFLPHYAGGTDFHPGGLAVVGEHGPEVVSLPRGSSVTPNGGGNDSLLRALIQEVVTLRAEVAKQGNAAVSQRRAMAFQEEEFHEQSQSSLDRIEFAVRSAA